MTWDMQVIEWIYEGVQGTVLNPFMVAISRLGNGGVLWISIGLILIFIPKHRKTAILMFISLALGYLIGDLLIKNLIQRPRPFMVNPALKLLISPPVSYSFPSGHTVSSFASAVVLARRASKRFYGLFWLLIAFVMGISRVYLSVHYPTDVFAGMILGSLVACFVLWLEKNQGKIVRKEK